MLYVNTFLYCGKCDLEGLYILLLHFINNILTCPHAQCQYRPGNIFICLRYKLPAIYTKQVFTIMCLAPFVQCRTFGIITHSYCTCFMNDLSGFASP